MNDAKKYYEEMIENYKRWKKDNFAQGAYVGFIEAAKHLAECNVENPFNKIKHEEKHEEVTKPIEHAEEKKSVVTGVYHPFNEEKVGK